jgi:long-chain acyl-CoA synthetase
MTFPFSTLPGLALHAGTAYRNPAALGYKRNGRWRAISSQEFIDSVRRAGECLIRLGLKPGDRVGIAADSSPFWLMADLATLGAGAVTVPLFPNAAKDVLRHQIADSGMRFLFVGNGDLRDAFAPLCESVERILVLSPRLVQAPVTGAWTRDPGGAENSADSSSGEEPLGSGAGEWDARAAAVRPDDTATLIYTSGSTGAPKGVELTHANIISQIHSAPLLFPLNAKTDSALSFLPLAHIFERMVACFYLASGVSVHFAEDMTVVPRFLEKALDRIQTASRDKVGPLRTLALAALRRAFERPEGAPRGWRDRVYDRLVYRKLRARMGGRLRFVICGSAPLDARLCLFFMNTGVQIYEGYGLTETSPVLTVNYPGHRRLGTVGKAFVGVDLRIAPDGEVLARGPNVMKGYYRLPDATRETMDAAGWLHTGDLGRFDAEGYLIVTGRKKELFKTAGGKYVAPIPIEHALTSQKLVEAAVVVAEGRPYVTALLFPDFDALLEWKDELDADGPSEGGGAFLRSQPVQEYFATIVRTINEGLSSWERIQKFSLADAPPTIEGGELTPTMKIRRHAVMAKYAAKIDAMYNG